MTLRKAALLAAAIARRRCIAAGDSAQAQNEQFFPVLVYRTGAYAPNGMPLADGVADYLKHDQRARRRHQRRQDHCSRNARPATPPTAASSATSA